MKIVMHRMPSALPASGMPLKAFCVNRKSVNAMGNFKNRLKCQDVSIVCVSQVVIGNSK